MERYYYTAFGHSLIWVKLVTEDPNLGTDKMKYAVLTLLYISLLKTRMVIMQIIHLMDSRSGIMMRSISTGTGHAGITDNKKEMSAARLQHICRGFLPGRNK